MRIKGADLLHDRHEVRSVQADGSSFAGSALLPDLQTQQGQGGGVSSNKEETIQTSCPNDTIT